MSKDNLYYIYDMVNQKYGETLLINFPKISRHIYNYINARSDVLGTKNPGLRLMYTPSTENDFFECCGVDRAWLASVIKESPSVCTINKKQMNPLYSLLMCLVCHYTANKEFFKKLNVKSNMTPDRIINFYLTLKLYSSCQIQIFKHVPSEDTMEYVINNLNNRFELASEPNLYTILLRYADSNSSSMNINFNHIKDKESFDYVDKLNNRIKSFLKKIFQQMLLAHKEGKTSQVQKLDSINAEGKVFLSDVSNISNEIELVTRKILNTFIKEKIIKKSLLQIACKKTTTSLPKMEIMIAEIRDSKDILLQDMIRMIISYWMMTLKETSENIHSKKFIVSCISAYAISNTNDQYILRLKEILHTLLNTYSDLYSSTERKPTLSNFKQCVFIYMVLYISSI